MGVQQANILAGLRKDILLMQGFKPAEHYAANSGGLSLIADAFPNSAFPTAAIHELLYKSYETAAATIGFTSCILSHLVANAGIAVFITSDDIIFPQALAFYGLNASNMLFVKLANEKHRLAAMEEVLKCNGITAVVGEIKELSFTDSRRFQLAAEQHGVTGFLLRQNAKNMATASVSRWKILPAPTIDHTGLPGLSYPAWNIELLRIRNGKPGSWNMQWKDGKLQHVTQPAILLEHRIRKIV